MIRDWAPQLPILEHPAIDRLVTHCVWNLIILCRATLHEKLETDALRIGVAVRAKEWRKRAQRARRRFDTAVDFFFMKSGAEAEKMNYAAKELGFRRVYSRIQISGKHFAMKQFYSIIQQDGIFLSFRFICKLYFIYVP